MMTAPRSIDATAFRTMMAGVCAPVTIVTTLDDGAPCGATVSSFASLSLDPPLVTVAFDNGSSVLAKILREQRFGVNLLGHTQADLAMLFASKGADRFGQAEWHFDNGLPRLDGAAGWLECELHQSVPGGDHLLLFGHVVGASRAELPPLVYAHRTFGTHSRYDERKRPLIVDHIAAMAR